MRRCPGFRWATPRSTSDEAPDCTLGAASQPAALFLVAPGMVERRNLRSCLGLAAVARSAANGSRTTRSPNLHAGAVELDADGGGHDAAAGQWPGAGHRGKQ